MSIAEEYPIIAAQFPGETIVDVKQHGGVWVILTGEKAYTLDEKGVKREMTDYMR